MNETRGSYFRIFVTKSRITKVLTLEENESHSDTPYRFIKEKNTLRQHRRTEVKKLYTVEITDHVRKQEK